MPNEKQPPPVPEPAPEPAFSPQADPFNPSPVMMQLIAAHVAGKGEKADSAKVEAWAKAYHTASGK